jgi:uncharacterized membrane protein
MSLLALESAGRTGAPMPSSAAAPRVRVDAVDLLRGLVMVVMLLDHTRDFVHQDALYFDPANLDRTTPALFFTRWITHYCAPIFVVLAGTGAYLQLSRGKTKSSCRNSCGRAASGSSSWSSRWCAPWPPST